MRLTAGGVYDDGVPKPARHWKMGGEDSDFGAMMVGVSKEICGYIPWARVANARCSRKLEVFDYQLETLGAWWEKWPDGTRVGANCIFLLGGWSARYEFVSSPSCERGVRLKSWRKAEASNRAALLRSRRAKELQIIADRDPIKHHITCFEHR